MSRFIEPVPRHVSHLFGPWGSVYSAVTTSNPTSATYESASLAVYFPIVIPTVCIARRMWWCNGATVSASYNVDAGIYTSADYKPATLLVSTGSTAQGTASQLQYADITDTTLTPGLYFLAMTCSSASATFFRIQSHVGIHRLHRWQQASALPLPASATPVRSTNQAIYLFGFATTASP